MAFPKGKKWSKEALEKKEQTRRSKTTDGVFAKDKTYTVICPVCEVARQVTYRYWWAINARKSSGTCFSCSRLKPGATNSGGFAKGSEPWNKGQGYISQITESESNAYYSAKSRCQNPTNAHYRDYGERGIEFRFTSLQEFMQCIGRKPTAKHTVDRFPDNNGHYEPGNVRWATYKEQAGNTRSNQWLTVNGVTKIIADWGSLSPMSDSTIRWRLKRGWCPECAVFLANPTRSTKLQCIHKKQEMNQHG